MTIQLIHRLTISNKDDARRYQLGTLYIEYFNQLNLWLDFLDIPVSSITMPMQLEATTKLHNMFILKFTEVLKNDNPFVDLNGELIAIESIELVCKTFTKNASNPTLLILFKSKPMEVVHSNNTRRVLRDSSTIDGEPLLIVDLDKDTRIASTEN